MAHQPKKDPVALITLVLGLLILGAAVFVLVSNLVSTISRNSVKGVEDNSREMAVANASLKPIGNVTAIDKSKPTVARKGDEIYKAVCTSCHGAGVLGSPKFGDKGQWAPRVANGLPALIKTATDGRGAMPPRGGDPTLSDEELKAAILYMTKEAGFDLAGADAEVAPAKTEMAVSAEAPAAPQVEAAPTPATTEEATPVAPAQPEPATEPAQPSIPAEPSSPAAPQEAAGEPETAVVVPVAPVVVEKVATAPKIDGEVIYKKTCFACHDTGVAASPLLGNKELWAPRIATGIDALYSSALKGKGAMPPKGGNFALSDDEVKATVDYMVSKAQ
ncbi:MAG TPA: cytochrome c5 family protein [Leucothrix mucor]|nr:cytochrome c5 family protein [Leucothrix mucor]